MKTWKKVAAAVLLLVVVGGFFAWRVIRRGFSARETPSKLEVLVATKARALAVPASYRSLKNLVSNSPENIRDGMEHFADHCFLCHPTTAAAIAASGGTCTRSLPTCAPRKPRTKPTANSSTPSITESA